MVSWPDSGEQDSSRHMRRFAGLLDHFPAGFAGNRLNLLFLDEAAAIRDGRAYLRRLHGPSLIDEQREYLLDDVCSWPFPRLHVAERPDPWSTSQRLFERFDDARAVLPTQGDIAERIDGMVRGSMPDVVALVIVDGLSYYDLPVESATEPCLVDGITITEHGYRQVVGQPSLSRRLFALGYAQQLGFTYFDPDRNDLARDVYDTFAPSQIAKVSAFHQVIQTLSQVRLARAYIQITLAGLDQVSHAHYDRPPLEHYAEQIMAHYHELVACLSGQHQRVLVVLTADHGLLWREAVEDKIVVVDDLFREDVRSPRYVKGSLLRPYGKRCHSNGQNYTLLGAPWMTRPFRSNEWGVHGGISAWESIVPVLIHASPGLELH